MSKKSTYEELELKVNTLEKETLKLRQTDKALKEQERLLNDIFESIQDGISVLDSELNIVRVNQAMKKWYSHTLPIEGMKCYQAYHGRDRACEVCPTTRALKTGNLEMNEVPLTQEDGIVGTLELFAFPMLDQSGNPTGVVEFVRDITQRKNAETALEKAFDELEHRVEQRTAQLKKINKKLGQEIEDRKRTEKALRENEEKYRRIFENIQDVYYEVALDGKILEISPSIEEVSGYKREKLIGKSAYSLYVDPGKRDEFVKTLLKNRKVTNYEILLKDKNNVQSYCSANAKLANDKQGKPEKIIGSLHNITRRKQAEEQIHSLTQELMRAHESERQRISRDLHDHVAQKLSALKIGYETLFDKTPGIPSKIRQKVSEMSKTFLESIKAVRDLAYDLRPPVLDEIGLVQTLLQYCRDFSENNGIVVDFHSAGMKDLKLDFDTEINLYRIVQEALANTRKHADARQVTVKIVAAFPNIILRINDNGKGFDVKNRLRYAIKEKRMGIRSMEERVKLLKGNMEIQSKSNQGTKIFIKFPYKGEKHGS